MKFCNTRDKADPKTFQEGKWVMYLPPWKVVLLFFLTEIQYSQVHLHHKLEKKTEQCPENLREDDLQARILYPAKIIQHKYSVDILRHAESPKISLVHFLSQEAIVYLLHSLKRSKPQ